MTIYAVFMCLALYADGPHCVPQTSPTLTYQTRKECEATIPINTVAKQRAPDGRFYAGSQTLWFECMSKHVEMWHG